MCGFFGWVGKGDPSADIEAVSKSLNHRGPDDSGFYKDDTFGLGFRRLSILDLSKAGHQPMQTADKLKYIAYNGEIFNYAELLKFLSEEDYPLAGHSDTEVLLKLIVNKEENVLPLLNGMFALAFVNKEQNQFLIARDRLGVKPLYYGVKDGSLYFASELPSLLLFGFKKIINKAALNKYVRFGHINPPETIFEGIFKLEPGHYLKGNLSDPGGFEKYSWWDLPMIEDYSKSESGWLSEIDDLLQDATKIRLASDVPVGLFLSGGIDSSLVAHYASTQSGFSKPKSLSVIFEEKEFNEYDIAQEVARAKNLELIPIKLKVNSLSEVDKINYNLGEPISDSSLINQYYLSQEARRHATVFLTGDGGDEAFCGYNEYIKTNRAKSYLSALSVAGKLLYSPYKMLVSKDSNLKQQLSKLSAGPGYIGTSLRNNYLEPVVNSLLSENYKVDESLVTKQIYDFWDSTKGLPLVKRMQHFDYKNYLEPDVLVKADRATMANSIEARSPFLDYRLVELAMGIPGELNMDKNRGKLLLRKLASKHLPEVVTNAPKKGFGLPIQHWIDNSIRNTLVNLNRENGHGIWDPKTFDYVAWLPFSSYSTYAIFWRLWMFEIWYKNNFKNG
jgi:asparagine synthase (glutamine-hydrolysing)